MTFYRAYIFLIAVLSVGLTAGVVSAGDKEGGVIQIEIGNEDRGVFRPIFEPIFDPTFGELNSDGHLSSVWKVSYTPNRTNPKWFKPIKANLFWLSDKSTVRTSSSIFQASFMPDQTQAQLGKLERPHAGFLAYEERISLSDQLRQHSQRIDTLTMTVGVVGPLSGAEEVHKLSHSIVGLSSTPWDELNNEPVLNFYYERAERFLLLKSQAEENLEFVPYGGVALGNAFTHGSLGATLRLGSHLTKDFGAYRMGPLLNGNNFAQKGDYLAWSVFIGAEGRAVARNLFLDGNTFEDSHSVDKNSLVGDAQIGFELGWGATRFTVTHLWRSEEFVTQYQPDKLLKAAFSYSF